MIYVCLFLMLYAVSLLFAYIDVYRYFLGVEKELKQNVSGFKIVFLPFLTIPFLLLGTSLVFSCFKVTESFSFDIFIGAYCFFIPFILVSFIEDGRLSYQCKSYRGIFKSFSKTEWFLLLGLGFSVLEILYYIIIHAFYSPIAFLCLDILCAFVFFWKYVQKQLPQKTFTAAHGVSEKIIVLLTGVLGKVFYYTTFFLLFLQIVGIFVLPLSYEEEVSSRFLTDYSKTN